MAILNVHGQDEDHVILLRMLSDWSLQPAVSRMVRKERLKFIPVSLLEDALAGKLDKATASKWLRLYLLNKPVRHAIAHMLHMRTKVKETLLRQELKEMAVVVKDWAKAGAAGLVVPDSTTTIP